MKEITLGAVESRFAEIVWTHAPLSSGELVKLCERELHWKKPTTYTVLRKLCGKGLFRNDAGTVSVVVSREAFNAARTERFVSDTWGGSLPAFVAAFLSRNALSEREADEIRRIIDQSRADSGTSDGANGAASDREISANGADAPPDEIRKGEL